MSLITRCPTCETMFRVVPDQLRVSEGWVRCGQCAAVFDATQHMVPAPEAPGAGATPSAPATSSHVAALPSAPPKPKPADAPPSTAAKADAPTAAAPTPTASMSTGADAAPGNDQTSAPDASATAPSTNRAVHIAAAEPAPGTSRLIDSSETPASSGPADPDDIWLDGPMSEPDTIILSMEDDPPEAIETVPPSVADAGPDVMSKRERASSDEPVIAKPSFLRDEPRPASVWRRPWIRIALLIVVLVLAALLGAQFLVKERSRVAAVAPAMRPVLQALCAVAGCSVAPLRQIESIVIDSSSFSRIRDNNYHLGFSLKNTAPIDVAMPAIELSLTDPQDQPVIRRVILPNEFGAPTAALTRNTVWHGSLALAVQTGAGAQRIAGYRLLAFYP